MKILGSVQRRFFRTWPVAAAALAGLLFLIGTSIVAISRKAEEIYVQLDQLNRHHREVEGTLRELRGDVQLSGIYIRDYLLDPERNHAPGYRKNLTDLRSSHGQSLDRLRRLLPRDTTPRLDNLGGRLDDYWEIFEPLFDWTAAEKIAHSAHFLRHEVLPRREAVLAITREIEEINDSNLAAQRAEVKRREETFRHDLQQRLWRTLLLGLAVAIVAVLRLRALERRSDEERERAEAAEQEMRLLSQQLVAAQEEERKKLTRELHDHVGQMLTALRMEIGRADRSRASADTMTAHALSEARRLLDTILRSVRDLVMGLRPSMLDDFGLQPALEWHVREFRRRFTISVDLTITGDLSSLPDQYRTCVYRIVQEALTNCARHALASGIRIVVAYDGSMLDLTVSDDGVGLDTPRTRGMGLIGIEERVRELHGSFNVQTRPQGGTDLTVSIPIEIPDQEVQLARAAG
ncbi:MAG TPA: sensor histidine kinase [Thermoanaerobaculia bacterium]|jgi:signal transduction histidine kinase